MRMSTGRGIVSGEGAPMRVRIVENATKVAEPVTGIYIRVTQEESVKTDLSIPNQRARGIELCAEHEWSPVRVYQEPRHVGGELMPERRPALAELLADVEAGRVARVLVRHADRLWRGTEVQDRILSVLRRHSVEFWDFSGQKDTRSAGGRFALKVQGAAAEYEKDLTGERIREMKRGKARAGKLAGGPPPFGYTSQSRIKRELLGHGVSEDEAHRQACERYPVAKTWYLDDAEADVVRLIFRLYLKERWGSRRISEELNRLGHRRRGGFHWSPVKVGKIVNNPAVCGLTSYDEEAYRKGLPSKTPRFRQTLFQGTHTPIIEPTDWREAQRLKTEVNSKRLRTASAATRVYPLSGILRCGVCGSPMAGKSSGTQREPYYICSRRAYYGPKDGCGGPTIHQRWAEVTVWKYLDQLFASPEVVREVLARAQKRLSTASPEMRRRLDDVHSEIADLRAKQEKWVKKFEATQDDAAAEIVWSRVRDLKTKELDLSREASELEAKLAAPPKRSISTDDIRAHLKRLPMEAGTNPEDRRRFAEALEHHHDLRVRLLPEHRLVVSLRLDQERLSVIGPSVPKDAIGTRLVFAGAVDTKAGRRLSGQVYSGRPEPGEPMNSRLCPPAAAISSARCGTSCPRTSARSGSAVRAAAAVPTLGSAAAPAMGSPRRSATSSPRCRGDWTSQPPTTAASPAFSGGTTNRLTRRLRAQAAIGKTPRTGRSVPSSASSPTNNVSVSAAASTAPAAQSIPTAIGTS
jgi:site-specific DNA recombinase